MINFLFIISAGILSLILEIEFLVSNFQFNSMIVAASVNTSSEVLNYDPMIMKLYEVLMGK